MKLTSKILGISAMSIGLTRSILQIESLGLPEVFSNIYFYLYLGLWLVGVLAFIAGSKK